MVRIVAGLFAVPVVTAEAVEQHLAFPRSGVAHVKTALNLRVKTAVGKCAAPVLVNVDSKQVLLTIKLDKSLLIFVQEDETTLVFPAVLGRIDKFSVEVELAGRVVVRTSKKDRTCQTL